MPIRSVKGRVVFSRKGGGKISTLKPIDSPDFCRYKAAPTTGNRDKP
ncbi:MAG: hypothetical protein LBV27_06710 [Oscillospiraceae bacterium]|nr:hypothetical protein [Oscillospiraceae bacterium]